MISKIISSSLFRSSGIYTIASLINASIPFILIPFLTKHLTPDEYGIVSMFMLTYTFLSSFIGLNVGSAISRKYIDYQTNPNKMAIYIGNCFLILLLTALIACIAFFIFYEFLFKITGLYSYWLYGTIIMASSQFLVLTPLILWQMKMKPLFYGIFQISLSVVNLLLTIVLVVYCEGGWQGRINAIIISNLLFAIISIRYLYVNESFILKYDKESFVSAIKFGLPLLPHTLGGIMIALTDRILIKNLMSLDDTGVYTIAYQITSLISILTTAFNSAYSPWLYNKLKKNSTIEKYRIVKYTYIYFFLLSLFTVAFVIIMPFILDYFIAENYWEAKKYIAWIALGFLFNGMYIMVTNYIFYSEKTYFLMLTTFSSALINLILCYHLIKENGVIGACQASAISLFCMFIFTWVLSNRVFKMPWGLKKIINE